MPWKSSILDTPVFCSVEPGKSYISKTMSLKYTDFDYHKRLGMLAGFPGGVHSYDLRRGAASAIDSPEVFLFLLILLFDIPLHGAWEAETAACRCPSRGNSYIFLRYTQFLPPDQLAQS